MASERTHDVLIYGTGLAGLRAAVEIARRSEGKVDIGLVSKVQIMRSHSVCAEGGTAGVLYPEEGDSFDLHAWDTIKGSDFLADQDVVDRFVRRSPRELLLLDHWGIPWSRDEDGRIQQRPFGGHSYPRATMAADKTGFMEMQTLYDTLLQWPTFTRYDEVFATGILLDGDRFAALTVIDAATGELKVLRAKALLIATGGAGCLYGYTTYSQTVSRRRSRARLPHRPDPARGHGVPPVPPDRPGALRHPDDRGLPRRGRLPAQRRRRALHGEVRRRDDGARAARHRVTLDDHRDPRRARGRRAPTGSTTRGSTSRTSAPTGSTSACR